MDAPVVIEARGVSKAFRVPDQRIDSLRERVTRPFTKVEWRMLHALRDVSFDVREGEFFGIVGRNGSGKSTLLKVLASIYASDAGTVRVAGRLAPFIELGVGFNPELAARENVTLNGVLMGLSQREARGRFDAVLDFAELHDFADLKLKNYSSGMLVRLAFAAMVQADPDIMLVDEVLAVGDAAFARKCQDVFQARRAAGRTVVLVTHDMSAVQSMCDRAMLLHDGERLFTGDPEQAALEYLRLNLAHLAPADRPHEHPDYNVDVEQAGLAGGTDTVEEGRPIRFDVRLRALRDVRTAQVRFQLRSERDVLVHEFWHDVREPVATGGHLAVRGEVENRLAPGRYRIDAWFRRDTDDGRVAVQGLKLLEFVVSGSSEQDGLVHVRSEVRVEAA